MGMGKLRIGGAWSGVLEVEINEWTVATLREEVAKKSGLVGPQCINLISAGRVLRDGDGTEKLSQLGEKIMSRFWLQRFRLIKKGNLLRRSFWMRRSIRRLSQLKGAATSLASRQADGRYQLKTSI